MHQPNRPKQMRPKEFLTIKLLDISENDQKNEKYKCNFLLHYCDWNSLDAEFENDEVQFFMLFGNKSKPKANLGIKKALKSVFHGGLFGKKKANQQKKATKINIFISIFHQLIEIFWVQIWKILNIMISLMCQTIIKFGLSKK